jgi:hypothetical protein
MGKSFIELVTPRRFKDFTIEELGELEQALGMLWWHKNENNDKVVLDKLIMQVHKEFAEREDENAAKEN